MVQDPVEAELEVDLLEGTLQAPSGSASMAGIEAHQGLQGESPQGAEAEVRLEIPHSVSGAVIEAGVQARVEVGAGRAAVAEGTRMRKLLTSVVENIWKLITN